MVKNPSANARDIRDAGSISGLGRPPRGHGNPLQYSCLENPTDRGAWWATIHRVTNSRIQLKQFSTHARCLLYFVKFWHIIYSLNLHQDPLLTNRKISSFDLGFEGMEGYGLDTSWRQIWQLQGTEMLSKQVFPVFNKHSFNPNCKPGTTLTQLQGTKTARPLRNSQKNGRWKKYEFGLSRTYVLKEWYVVGSAWQ